MTATVEYIIGSFNPEQLAVYQQLRTVVEQPNSALRTAVEQPNDAYLCFLDSKARRRKTFLINCLVISLCAQGTIVLVVGSTALSIIYYDRGCTAHSAFGILVVEVGY